MPTSTRKPARRATAKRPHRKAEVLKDPRGGLTAAGRAAFRRKEGAHLKPGVTKPEREMSADEMRRKGSFLRRHFANLRGPLKDDDGRPTRLALSAHAWGEPVPRTPTAAARLAQKGTRLLERYHRMRDAQKPASRRKAK